jgi:membrane-bound lytic murein transglycosylase D
MLIRVRRNQTMEAIALRYGVSVGQLKAWNRTHRDKVSRGQVIVLHVPVGKAVPSEPGPERIATDVQGGGVEKIGTRVGATHGESRDDKRNGHGRSGVVKVSEPVGKVHISTASSASKGKMTKVSVSTSNKASKAAVEHHPKTAASGKKGK